MCGGEGVLGSVSLAPTIDDADVGYWRVCVAQAEKLTEQVAVLSRMLFSSSVGEDRLVLGW